VKIDNETDLSVDDSIAAALDGAGVPRLSVGLLGRVRWLAQVAAERGEALARLTQEDDSARTGIMSLESQLAGAREQRAAIDRALTIAGQPMDELMTDQGVIRLYHELMATRRQLDVVYDDLRREREASQRAATEATARELSITPRLVELEGSNSRLKRLVDDALKCNAALESKIERTVQRCAELEDKIAVLERVS